MHFRSFLTTQNRSELARRSNSYAVLGITVVAVGQNDRIGVTAYNAACDGFDLTTETEVAFAARLPCERGPKHTRLRG